MSDKTPEILNVAETVIKTNGEVLKTGTASGVRIVAEDGSEVFRISEQNSEQEICVLITMRAFHDEGDMQKCPIQPTTGTYDNYGAVDYVVRIDRRLQTTPAEHDAKMRRLYES